jgi:hypothetical protein
VPGKDVPCQHDERGIDGGACAVERLAGCQSTVLGPGEVAPAPAGFVRWGDLTPGQRAALEVPGRLMVARREWAEAAVDRSLVRYLGWWKGGWFRPDSDLPAVRDALVAKLAADRWDIRKLELEIVTSVLYSQAAARRPEQSRELPPWAFGPTKMQAAEPFLDGLEQAVGKDLGGCDFRYSNVGMGGGAELVPGYFHPPGAPARNPYLPAARNMGGCPLAAAHGDPSGLVAGIARSGIVAEACAGAFAPVPNEPPEALVDRVFSGVGRPPAAGERSALLRALAEGGPDDLCEAVYGSAAFLYY